MRKVFSGLFISLDGVVEAPHLWQFDVFDKDMEDAMNDVLADQDAMLLGRVTYEEWAPYWPTSDDGFADFINPIPKYVFSTTLDKVDWQNSTLVKGSTADAINELKRQPGGKIGVGGSPTLVRSLLQDGLLDELILMIHPVIVGKGKHLFTEDLDLKRMELVDSRITGSGVAILTYRPK